MLHTFSFALLLHAMPVANQGETPPVPPFGPGAPGEENTDPHPFRIPDYGAAKRRFDSAEGHIAGRRWSEALADLQGLLEEHRGDLLAGERPVSRANRPSLQPVHPGAAVRARQRLWSLPVEAKRLYRERHEGEARAAFERARAEGDRSALAEVARRWPLCDAARSAWWALGDLERERGDDEKARSAWTRALQVALADPDLELADAGAWTRARARLHAGATPGATAQPGIDGRVDLAIADLGAGATAAGAAGSTDAARPASEPSADGLHPSDTHVGRIPLADADTWARPYSIEPSPFRSSSRQDVLFPARSGDVLLISNSLRLAALHAWSGTTLWISDALPGWNLPEKDKSDLFEGVDEDSALVAPAATEHVALAALQIPIAFVQKRMFQQISITTPMPERRLFAFDLATGRKLWSHEPPPAWDGESGSFSDRMSVAGPPVVSGSRVLAPFGRIQGRIDYHVACFDVDTGALLWSTALISGQRELNMFGRAEHEYSAPPLVVRGDRVIALTQLGTIAALDLFTGEILWETLYDQIPIPKNIQGYRAMRRQLNWKNAAPVVVEKSAGGARGGIVIAAPSYCESMIGVDLVTGALAWTLSRSAIDALAARADPRAPRLGMDLLLVGARDDTVYLAGTCMLALVARGGLALQPPASVGWITPDEAFDSAPPGRPVLAGERLIVPTRSARCDLDVEQGRILQRTSWGEDGLGGNLLVGAGEVFAVSRTQAQGWFDWDALIARARRDLVERPTDGAPARALAELLFQRGSAEWQKGDSIGARRHLEEAEGVLTAAIGRATGELRSTLSAEMHSVLRAQARVRAGLADRAGALAALRRARPLAPDALSLRDTLLEELATLRGAESAVEPGRAPGREPGAAEGRAGVLAELERSCSDLPVVCDSAEPETPAAPAEARPDEGAFGRFVPLVGGSSRSDAVPCEMPIGLWVQLERLSAAARARDSAGEFVALHAILERYADVELPPGRSGDLATARIAFLLRTGRTQGFAVFETKAQTELDQAVAAHDRDRLGRLSRRFPSSKAADRADDLRLEWALSAGDPGEVARIVGESLPRAWRIESATAREALFLRRVCAAFERAGNVDLAAELGHSLAVRFPDLASDFPDDAGRTLADLAAALPRSVPPDAAPPTGTFGANPTAGEPKLEDQDILGLFPPEGRPSATDAVTTSRVLLIARNAQRRPATLYALGSEDPGTVKWEYPLPAPGPGSAGSAGRWTRLVAFAAGRALVISGTTVVALDPLGRKAWEWDSRTIAGAGAPDPTAIVCSAGVAVVTLESSAGRHLLHALDAHGGVDLWTETIPEAGIQPVPLLSSTRVVILPYQGRRTGLVLDLFTGRRAIAFDLGAPATSTIAEDAWIEGERLIVPWFGAGRLPDRNQVAAIDLGTGASPWRIAVGELDSASNRQAGDGRPDRRELGAVFQDGDRTWVYVRPVQGIEGTPPPGAVYELTTRIGALSPVAGVRIGDSDQILGITRQGRMRLSSRLVFLLTLRTSPSEARLRAVDLSRGELWSQVLPPRSEDIYTGLLPQPALSETAVAVTYTVEPRRQPQAGKTTRIDCFDRASGMPGGSVALPPQAGQSNLVRIFPLGSALVVEGRELLEILQ